MPIPDEEWDAGTRRGEAETAATTPVGEHETEEDLMGALFSENVANAYTRTG